MTTKFVGMKKFRDNISSYIQLAQKTKIRYILLKKNVPVVEVIPVNEKQITFEKLATEICEARKQVQRGETYSHRDIMREFGLE